MDPYLEDPAFWADFHATFIGAWREAIARKLPEPYEARLGEHVKLVQMPEEVIKLIYPDVAVTRPTAKSRTPATAEVGTATLEPVTLRHELLEQVRETHIEIRRRPDRGLVAVLELLSPWNKTGDGFAEYRVKRKSILQQQVHLVEVDLLLAGTRLPMRDPMPAGDYYALVTRAEDRSVADAYAWTLRQALPVLPVPLRKPDPDIQIDLQAVFQVAFERGQFVKALLYNQPPWAPMREEDKAWAATLLAQRNGA